jgi:hypothetical protein
LNFLIPESNSYVNESLGDTGVIVSIEHGITFTKISCVSDKVETSPFTSETKITNLRLKSVITVDPVLRAPALRP